MSLTLRYRAALLNDSSLELASRRVLKADKLSVPLGNLSTRTTGAPMNPTGATKSWSFIRFANLEIREQQNYFSIGI